MSWPEKIPKPVGDVIGHHGLTERPAPMGGRRWEAPDGLILTARVYHVPYPPRPLYVLYYGSLAAAIEAGCPEPEWWLNWRMGVLRMVGG